MTFDAPIPFREAMNWIAGKITTPTDQSSAEIASTWTKEARALSLYSARTNEAAYLEEIRVALQHMHDGTWNEATARQHLQLWCDKLGYTPENGWPGQTQVPPALVDSLRDLSSDERIKLVIETGVRMASNTAYMAAGTMDPDRLKRYPAWELVRVYSKKHPRGSTDKDTDLGWRERWVRAGGRLIDGRMVARKDDPIWQMLGDSGLFSDGTDSDAPPYAFNSGMGLREISAAECAALGMDLSGIAPKTPSLLGHFFDGHPERATLADLKSTRQEIVDALAELKEAA
jgi:hypothetical protein